MRPNRENLGTPDLKIAGLQLWLHGWQFPNARDDSDATWLTVTAHCGGEGADVWAYGSFLQIDDIERFGKEAEALFHQRSSQAGLEPLEPTIQAIIRQLDKTGHLVLEVRLTPDHLTQAHLFRFEIDQSYLPLLVKECHAILERFPADGRSARGA